MIVLSIINNLPHPRKNSFSFSLDLYKSKLISITPPSIPSTCSNIKFKKKKLIIDELIYISFPNYIRKFLPAPRSNRPCSFDQSISKWRKIDAGHDKAAISSVGHRDGAIFMAWHVVSSPPLKSRIQRRSTMNSIK